MHHLFLAPRRTIAQTAAAARNAAAPAAGEAWHTRRPARAWERGPAATAAAAGGVAVATAGLCGGLRLGAGVVRLSPLS